MPIEGVDPVETTEDIWVAIETMLDVLYDKRIVSQLIGQMREQLEGENW